MSRKYKVETYTRKMKVVDKIKCEFCGKTTDDSDHVFGSEDCGDWGNKLDYETDIIILGRKKGKNYPEDAFIDHFYWDVCPSCFEKKILPHLPEKHTKNEEDY